MCKILIMPGIKDEVKDQAWEFIKEMSKQMSSPHSPESDGIGYAAIDNDGKLFGERWFNNKEAFKHQNAYGSEINDMLMKKFKILNMEKVYNNFGTFNPNIKSVTLHSRSATNAKTLKNTHPFVEDYTSVIHNGVIYNDDKLTKKYSTCDSEVILHEYVKHNVRNKIFKIKKLINKLEGYYAMGIFSRMENGTPILDIVKDSTAKLEAYFVKELDMLVYATPRFNTSTVEEACKVLGFEILSKFEVKSNKMQRHNALTGEVLGLESFKAKDFKRAKTTETTTYGGHRWNGGYYSGDYDYRDSRYDDAYKKAFETDVKEVEKENKIITLPPKPEVKNDHREKILEQELERMLLDSKEYTEAEINELAKKFLPEVVKNLEKTNDEVYEENRFGDAGDTDWYRDDKLVWHKRSM